MNFNFFCCTFPNLDIVLMSHVFLNIIRQVITRNTDGLIRNDTSQRDHGDLRGTTTYIHDHVTFRGFHVQADTQSGSHRLVNHIDIPSSGVFGRVSYGT